MHKLTVFFLLVCGISSAQNDSCAFFGNKPIFPYYLGLLYKYKKANTFMGIRHLKDSRTLLLKSYKQQDVYVELFDEVYMAQVAEEFND